jgi:deoxyribodipyrimidine photolyase-related protein
VKVNICFYKTPCFLNSLEEGKDFLDKKKTYFLTDFYIDQRKRRKLLVSSNGAPEGGRWSYDADNRLRFPKNEKPPEIILPSPNKYIAEVRNYVEKNYKDNYGNSGVPFENNNEDSGFPVTFDEAEDWLDTFLKERFELFGKYQDAMVAKEHVLNHSVLTPMLNTGLLTPQYIIDKALHAAANYHIPLNSLEGFLRQVRVARVHAHSL